MLAMSESGIWRGKTRWAGREEAGTPRVSPGGSPEVVASVGVAAVGAAVVTTETGLRAAWAPEGGGAAESAEPTPKLDDPGNAISATRKTTGRTTQRAVRRVAVRPVRSDPWIGEGTVSLRAAELGPTRAMGGRE
jgi:hypothetical protein